MTDHLPYRPCVGVMMINAAGKVWVGERFDTPDAWQMPQGGIDKGEDPTTAAFRELEEEIGVKQADVTLLDQTHDWLYYDLPKHLVTEGKVWGGRYRGQKQLWYLVRLNAEDHVIELGGEHEEFSRWQWVEPSHMINLIVPFKRDIYIALLEAFKDHF